MSSVNEEHNINQDKRIQKTKEEKDATKALKKLEKEKRKEKTLQKVVKNENTSSSDKNKSTESKKSEKALEVQTSKKNTEPSHLPVNLPSCVLKKTLQINKENVTDEMVKPKWFSHLFQPDRRGEFIENMRHNQECNIHPEFLKFATDIDCGKAQGSTLRCQLFLKATKAMVMDLPIEDDEYLSRRFTTQFENHILFISRCRPLAVTMLTAIKYLKSNSSTVTETNNEKCKNMIIDMIDQFMLERIDAAQKTIVSLVSKHLKRDADVLVYSYSQVVLASILHSRDQLGPMNIYVVDSAPDDGSARLKSELGARGVPFTAVPMAAMPRTVASMDMVILGAHSLIANSNTVVSRSGTASIANAAHLHRVPVMVCAETYKFYVPSPAEPAIGNELAGAGQWPPAGPLASLVTPVRLMYDTISPTKVTMVCCELGTISPSTGPFVAHLKEPVAV